MKSAAALFALLPLISATWIPRQAASAASSLASAAGSVVASATTPQATSPTSSRAAELASSIARSSAVSAAPSAASRSATANAQPPAPSSTASAGSSGPKVTIYPYSSPEEGVTISGVRTSSLVTDAYLGIPFAAPPTGDLRFVAPQLPTWNTSTFNANRQPPACLQRNSTQYGANGYSEDRLYLNVFTPQGANVDTAHLPVFVWVYGGGFTSGSASIYNASLINAAGVQSNRPFISVVINYRLGFFGWPYGKEIADNNAGNLGLRDVIASLQWVQDNIWAFGGDASRVTLGGQSAGAIAIALLYLQQDLGLFRSAIIQSGGTSTAPISPTGEAWEDVYNLIVASTGCNVTAAATGNSSTNATANAGNFSSSFECLKYAPANRLLAAQVAVQSSLRYGSSFTFAPSIDYDLVPASPHSLVAAGQFARKPMINGNVKDEGTIFAPRAVSAGQIPILLSAIAPRPPANATLAQLLQLYPNVPALGSPYGTGNETFGLDGAYKQAASIVGDNAFQANRRWLIRNSQKYFPDVGVYSYFFNQSTPGADPSRGVFHGSEVPYTFGSVFAGGNYTQADQAVSSAMGNYWINFIYNQDPNGGNATYWPAYGGESEQNMLQMQAGNLTVIRDNYREEQIAFFNAMPGQFNLKKRGVVEEEQLM